MPVDGIIDWLWPGGWLGWLVRLVITAVIFSAVAAALSEFSEELALIGCLLIAGVALIIGLGLAGWWVYA